MPTLYIAANRALMTVERDKEGRLFCRPSTGGLAAALRQNNKNEELKVRYLGWPGLTVGEHEKIIVDKTFLDNDMFAVYLSSDEKKSFYDGCNKILWPLLHEWPVAKGGGISSIEFDDGFWPSYQEINQRFADAIVAKITEETETEPLVWVHDYHLMLSPEKIKEKCPEAKIGFFLHIPFPPYVTFDKHSKVTEMLKPIIAGLRACDHISFQTTTYRDNFIDCVRQVYGNEYISLRQDSEHDFLLIGQRIIEVNVTPIGIDYERYATDYNIIKNLTAYYEGSAGSVDVVQKKQAIVETRQYKEIHKHQKTLCSIGRLDNSKGFLEQLRAYQRYLAKHPEQVTTLKLRLVVVPSRTTVKAYQDLKKAIDALVADINKSYSGSHGVQPIDYQYDSFDLPQVTEFYREADIMLVTPKRDGMNLVCEEYVAARQAKHGGVLVLGQGAGAADLLCDAEQCAILVNPGEDASMDRAFKQALGMPLVEQQSRLTEMKRRVKENNVFVWRNKNIEMLTARQHTLPVKPMPSSTDSSPIKLHDDSLRRRRSSSSPSPKCLLFTDKMPDVVVTEIDETRPRSCSDAGNSMGNFADNRLVDLFKI